MKSLEFRFPMHLRIVSTPISTQHVETIYLTLPTNTLSISPASRHDRHPLPSQGTRTRRRHTDKNNAERCPYYAAKTRDDPLMRANARASFPVDGDADDIVAWYRAMALMRISDADRHHFAAFVNLVVVPFASMVVNTASLERRFSRCAHLLAPQYTED